MSEILKEPRKPPRVFLSYSHDSREHQERVLALADRLRAEGVDARLDQYEAAPPDGWATWTLHQLETADFVLVLCTETYRRRFERREKPEVGKGATWEGAILTQELYNAQVRSSRIVPVVLAPADTAHIPIGLQGSTFYAVASEEGYESLYRRLTGQPAVPMPVLGERRELPAKDRRTSFLGEPLAPAPVHRDEEFARLYQRRKELQTTYEELMIAGGDPAATLAELRVIKSQIRSGGQVKPGDELADHRYRLLEPLGRGGFATVWKAWDRKLRQTVAVKVLHGELAQDRTRRERFFRGAREMARLHHPGIVRVLAEELEDEGYHFFVMEYLPGGDLRQAVLGKRLSSEQALQAVIIVGEALSHAHQQGIVHRDIKPANILLDGEGRPKLTDFDLVRAFDSTGGTKTGTHLGSFLYAAPEAMTEGKEADALADQYSLAMTACFVLLGKDLPPAAVFDLAGFRRSLPCSEAVSEVLARATELEASRRFADVLAMIQALTQARAVPLPLPAPALPSARPDSVRPAPAEPLAAPIPTLRSEPRPGLPPNWGGTGSGFKALLILLETGQPAERLAALARLRSNHYAEIKANALLARLPAGRELGKLMEKGVAELSQEERNRFLPTVIEVLLPRLRDDMEVLGAAAWVLDYFLGRSTSVGRRTYACRLREALIQPLRKRYPPPDRAIPWVPVPAGTFILGDQEGGGDLRERPAHRVDVSAFRMHTHPTTNQEMRLLFPAHEGDADLPAVNVSWYQAYAFAAWLGGRLPTEAEWEYAARAGSSHLYCDRFGQSAALAKVAWCSDNSDYQLHPVGLKEPNPWGLHDLYGNVWEWVADWYAPYSAGDETDPWGPSEGMWRVIRGGSAWNDEIMARAAYRLFKVPEDSGQARGFRVVLPVDTEP